MLESKKAQGTILNGLNSIQQMISEENKKEEIIFIDTFEDEGWLPQQGKIYRRASPDGPKMQYMIKGNLIFFEMELKDGKEWYIVVDFKGMVHDMVLPYPVEEYTIEMPDDLIIETQKEKQQWSNPLLTGQLFYLRGFVLSFKMVIGWIKVNSFFM